MRSPDERDQGQVAAAMPDGVVTEVQIAEAVEMTSPWKAWKTKDGFPTLSPVPWESRRNREIPTFPQPFATMNSLFSLKIKNQRKEVGRCAASPISNPFALWSRTDFMLILRLENALTWYGES